jgi:uncharacterized protein YunC (DUF1805 family)
MIEKKTELGGTVVYNLSVGDTHVPGFATNIPNTTLHILQARCRNGMLFCGLFSREVLEKLNFPAAVFSAPAFSDMMERNPVYLTPAARELGATEEMTGEQLLVLFN